VSFGLVPLDDGRGGARGVLLWVWLLNGRGAAMVQPILRGDDEPLPWGLHTSVTEVPHGTPADGIRGMRDLVMPMVLALEALTGRGLTGPEIAGMWGEVLLLADRAAAGIAGLRDLADERSAGPDPGD
jgi:hypothetical protein